MFTLYRPFQAENMIKFLQCWWFVLQLACFVNALVWQTQNEPDLVRFELEEIVPYVLPRSPHEIAYVYYPGHEVNPGDILTPSKVRDPPYFSYTADQDKYYALMMVDPDAPSRASPFYREWLHWLAVNIPGNNVSNGETLAAYIGPAPARNTGLHRYVFAVYGQPSGNVTFEEPILGTRHNSPSNRANFSVRNFALRYHLGDPLAGNYFLSK